MKILIVCRSTADSITASHAGLGICAINTTKTLNQHGIKAEMYAVTNAEMIVSKLKSDPEITHVVIQAPWIPTIQMESLGRTFPHIEFATNCHSNVGFLQTEPQAITLLIDLCSLEQMSSNVHCAGNSMPFVNWIREAYQSPCTYLPNLYYVDDMSTALRPLWNGGLLRLGIFGAPRSQKNVMTSVAGAIEVAQHLKAHTEIWLNSGRDERDGKTIREAAKRAIARNHFCTYREFPWAPWPEFRRFIGTMNLLLQVSYTESFNQVTADGIVMGVPSVVSEAIRWAPAYWQAEADDAQKIAATGIALLRNHRAAHDGLQALLEYDQLSLHAWKKYLKI